MSRASTTPIDPDDRDLKQTAADLGFHGLVARWDAFGSREWVPELLEIEREERARRSLERRLRNARLLSFKSLADFQWAWPKKIDREQVEDLMHLRFLDEAANVLLVGPNGVGKTMIAKNVANAAVLAGKRVRFTTAAALLNDLGSQDTTRDLERRLRRYANPELLVIDEVGYLACSADHADLLFEVINRRYEQRSTIVTTNKPFAEWGTVFRSAASVTVMVDRLVHRSELVVIEGNSFRCHEAKERQDRRRRTKSKAMRKKKPRSGPSSLDPE